MLRYLLYVRDILINPSFQQIHSQRVIRLLFYLSSSFAFYVIMFIRHLLSAPIPNSSLISWSQCLKNLTCNLHTHVVRAKSCVYVCVCACTCVGSRVYVREKIISYRFVIVKYVRVWTSENDVLQTGLKPPSFRKLHLPSSVLRHTAWVSILVAR